MLSGGIKGQTDKIENVTVTNDNGRMPRNGVWQKQEVGKKCGGGPVEAKGQRKVKSLKSRQTKSKKGTLWR